MFAVAQGNGIALAGDEFYMMLGKRLNPLAFGKKFSPPLPPERSEHNLFIQPAAKRRPFFTFGNTSGLLSATILYNYPLNQPALWAEPIGQCVST